MCFFTNLPLRDVATLRGSQSELRIPETTRGGTTDTRTAASQVSLLKEVEEAGAPVSQELQRVNLIVKNFFLGGHHFAKAIGRTRVLTENDSGRKMRNRGCSMPQVWPWYSTSPGEAVHHDNTKCAEGKTIEDCDRKPGTGGLPLCRHCARLDAEGE